MLFGSERILKPGGILWLTTHGMWPHHPTPKDNYRWTLEGLEKILGSRFNIINTRPIMGSPAYAIMIYLNLMWEATRLLNHYQCVILNQFSKSKKWGKSGKRKNRINNKYVYV